MKFPIPLILGIAVLIMLSCAKTPVYKEPPFDGKNYVIPVVSLKEGSPIFYTVSTNGKKINFFVLLVNGEVQSYFDACRKCFPYKLGYRAEGGLVGCRYCNEKYPVEALKEGVGSCHPIHLKGTVVGDGYAISVDALSAGAKLF